MQSSLLDNLPTGRPAASKLLAHLPAALIGSAIGYGIGSHHVILMILVALAFMAFRHQATRPDPRPEIPPRTIGRSHFDGGSGIVEHLADAPVHPVIDGGSLRRQGAHDHRAAADGKR